MAKFGEFLHKVCLNAEASASASPHLRRHPGPIRPAVSSSAAPCRLRRLRYRRTCCSQRTDHLDARRSPQEPGNVAHPMARATDLSSLVATVESSHGSRVSRCSNLRQEHFLHVWYSSEQTPPSGTPQPAADCEPGHPGNLATLPCAPPHHTCLFARAILQPTDTDCIIFPFT